MLSGEKLQFLRITHKITQMIEHNDRQPSPEVYNAMINCIYGIGKPLKKNKSNNQEQESE